MTPEVMAAGVEAVEVPVEMTVEQGYQRITEPVADIVEVANMTPGFSGGQMLGALVGGVVVGGLLTILGVYLVERHKAKKSTPTS